MMMAKKKAARPEEHIEQVLDGIDYYYYAENPEPEIIAFARCSQNDFARQANLFVEARWEQELSCAEQAGKEVFTALSDAVTNVEEHLAMLDQAAEELGSDPIFRIRPDSHSELADETPDWKETGAEFPFRSGLRRVR